MNCQTCNGTMSQKVITFKGQPKSVWECNQDNGDCLNEKGYPTSFWPKGTRQQAQPPVRGVTRRSGPEPAARNKDDYWQMKEQRDREAQPIIRRSHAQEMALRTAAIDNRIIESDGELDLKKLKWFINWFQRDAERGGVEQPAPEPTPDDFGPDDDDTLTL